MATSAPVPPTTVRPMLTTWSPGSSTRPVSRPRWVRPPEGSASSVPHKQRCSPELWHNDPPPTGGSGSKSGSPSVDLSAKMRTSPTSPIPCPSFKYHLLPWSIPRHRHSKCTSQRRPAGSRCQYGRRCQLLDRAISEELGCLEHRSRDLCPRIGHSWRIGTCIDAQVA